MGLAQSPTTAQNSISLSGRVLDTKSGAPIRNAVLQLVPLAQEDKALAAAQRERLSPVSANRPAAGSATSDADGNYAFETVGAGQYTLSATKLGYLDTRYGATDPFQAGSIINVQPGRPLNLNVKMLLPGTISGKVIDDAGEPVDGGTVRLISSVWSRGELRHLVVAGSRPNDLGEFRFGKVRPGRYFLCFTPTIPRGSSAAGGIRSDHEVLASVRTFHPSATMIDDAEPVAVEVGSDVRAANIVVQQRATHAIRGKIISGPVLAAAMNLTPADEDSTALALSGANLGPTGEFAFLDVPPGLYKLTYLASIGKGSSQVETEIRVEDADVTGVTVAIPPPATIRGQITVNPAEAQLDLSKLTVTLVAADALVGPSYSAGVHTDGSFVIDACSPGRYQVAIKGPQEIYAKTLLVGSQELPDRLLSVSGSDVRLEVAVRTGAAQIQGTINGGDGVDNLSGVSAAAYYVLLPDMSQASGSGIRLGHSDQNGTFLVRGLAPGRYRVFCFESPSLAAFDNPSVLKAVASLGTEVEVNENDSVPVTVSIISRMTADALFSQDR
jgi:hypothetical protein